MRWALSISKVPALFATFAATVSLFAEPPSNVSQALALRWTKTSIKIAFSSSLTTPNPNIKTGTDVGDVIQRSLLTWENASAIKFIGTQSDRQSVSPSGISGDGISLITIAQTPENLALFQNDWQSTSARTRVFYNRKNEITEADIVLNPYVQFSDDGTFGTFDLESTLTHEIGHLLGLGHSFSFGSAMYANYGRNGIFGVRSRNTRTLSPEDISALRGIYGSVPEDDSCCGQVYGRLTMLGGRPAADFEVWAEDGESGLVFNGTISLRSGSYRINGLPNGKYRIYAQDKGSKLSFYSAFEMGEIEIEKGKASLLSAVVSLRKLDLDLRYLGINSQIADAAIPVNAGRTYVIYLGGSNLDPARTSVGVNSPFISVDSEAVTNVDFSDKISVIRSEFTIDPKTPPGDYSIFVKASGVSRYIVGGIAVRAFVDP